MQIVILFLPVQPKSYIVQICIFLGMNYAEVANEMNPWAADYVSDHKGKKTGIVMMDFGGIDQFFWGCFYTRGIDLPVNLVENNKYL